ncbi:MAG TPA: hypothetical protein VGH73_05575 [Thermoanaerobaculia bacterium]
MPAILLVLGSHAAAAQEAGSDTARAIAETRNGIGRYMSDVRARTTELKRKIDVLGDLTDAADAISPVAMGLSLTRSRQKVENAKHTANQEPPLGEPVPTVLDIVSQLVNTPPFGMPADQLRARLFVEISRLEEDILRQSETFQREADGAESMERSLEQITAGLRSTAAAGTRALLQTRRRALKSGS